MLTLGYADPKYCIRSFDTGAPNTLITLTPPHTPRASLESPSMPHTLPQEHDLSTGYTSNTVLRMAQKTPE